jgi:hypothetical protein
MRAAAARRARGAGGYNRLMQLEIEVWLRGNDFATTDIVEAPLAAPERWTDRDVRTLLEELLRAIERARHPDAERGRPVALRGFSWIVSPFESGGYTVAVEIQLGAAAAGPFAVDQPRLEQAIGRVMAADRVKGPGTQTVH